MANQGKRRLMPSKSICRLYELSDDLLVEISSRVPFKSICCCKCVSTRWRDLISHPEHRRKLPRSTLAGFFFQNYKVRRLSVHPGYQSVPAGNWCARNIDTSLSFFPRCQAHDIFLLDCCNGLLLCRHRMMRTGEEPVGYVVCNPATQRRVAVPATGWSSEVPFARLAFDPDVSSGHFHVFEFATVSLLDAKAHGMDGERIKAVRIYSSQTGDWTDPIVRGSPLSLSIGEEGAFCMGQLYLSSSDNSVLAVGMEGNCRAIRVPQFAARGAHTLYQSQGKLHLVNKGASELSIWALEDSISETWALKHIVTDLQLLVTNYSMSAHYYKVISVHPESNVVFILCEMNYNQAPTKLMSYEIDSRKLSFISDLPRGSTIPFISYVPLFSDSLAHGH